MTRFRLRDWRFWLVAYENNLGLLVVLGLAVPLVGLIFWLLNVGLSPMGEMTTVEGSIVGMGFQETKVGSVPTGSVRLNDATVQVRLPARFGCRIGDRIQLRQRKTRFGHDYSVGATPRPCSRS